MDALTVLAAEACCLKLDPIPESFSGTLTFPVADQSGVTVNVRIYKAGHSTPALVPGTIDGGGILTITPTATQQAYFNRYARKLVIEAFTTGTLERINFGADSKPAMCAGVRPCAQGESLPGSLTLAEYTDLCPGCNCGEGCA